MRRQLAFLIFHLRTAGLLTCVGTLLFLLQGPGVPHAHAQISPGPISKSHQFLSGSTNCTKCHDLGRGKAQLKCLECHTEIGARVAQRRGMHAVWVNPNGTSKDCAKCHSEHNGSDFELIHWLPSRDAMDHSKTGFALAGKHAGVGCASCHKSEFIAVASRGEILLKDLNRTYLGLTKDCTSCHRDEHRGQLGKNCASWERRAQVRWSQCRIQERQS